jgi:alcohol dehydrogenase (cytochrome c)
MPCCDVVNRGAALFGDLVIFGTLDAQLVALNQDTGKVAWKEKVDDYKAGYSNTAAPLIVKGVSSPACPAASSASSAASRRVMPRPANSCGRVRPSKATWARYDKRQGQRHHRQDQCKSWPGDQWKTGGAATWLGGTYDPDTGLAYFGTGNPAPWNSHLRPGDNLYSSSTLAIEADTGQIKWATRARRMIPGTSTAPTSSSLRHRRTASAESGGKADRNGFFYVLDAPTASCSAPSPSCARSPGPAAST